MDKIDRIAGFIEQYAKRLPAGDEWLNEAQACGYLQVSPKTLQRLRKRGDITFSAIAGKRHYRAGDIRALMERKSIKSGREQLEKLRRVPV